MDLGITISILQARILKFGSLSRVQKVLGENTTPISKNYACQKIGPNKNKTL